MRLSCENAPQKARRSQQNVLPNGHFCRTALTAAHQVIVHLQIGAIRKQSTKFGDVLVAETLPQPNKFLLGFQVKPTERLDAVVKQATAMLQLHAAKPDFGLRAADFVDPQHLSESTQALFDTECDRMAYAIAVCARKPGHSGRAACVSCSTVMWRRTWCRTGPEREPTCSKAASSMCGRAGTAARKAHTLRATAWRHTTCMAARAQASPFLTNRLGSPSRPCRKT